jgi:PAS domain S-box-containing protein
MRINQPVSQCERVVDDGAFLVSKTDLKGRIVYANAAFVAISGFTEDELIGSAHNMVRHPDMPPAAFDDMWRALKAGRQWQGVVKNRCKNGDYYWVWANANPIWEDGHVVGFMSLRTRASSEQIEQADAFYRTLREGRRAPRNRPPRSNRPRAVWNSPRARSGAAPATPSAPRAPPDRPRGARPRATARSAPRCARCTTSHSASRWSTTSPIARTCWR